MSRTPEGTPELGMIIQLRTHDHPVTSKQDAEDVQVLLILDAERAAERGDAFEFNRCRYEADRVAAMWNALEQGRLQLSYMRN